MIFSHLHHSQEVAPPLNCFICCRVQHPPNAAPSQHRLVLSHKVVCADAVDLDAKEMDEGGLKLPRARELARLVFGEDLEALAGRRSLQHRYF